MNNYSVYMLTSKDNRVYIGMTGQPVRNRCRKDGYNECPRMRKAIHEHGWDFFETSIIATGLTKEQAEQCEKSNIAKYDSTNPSKGFNVDLAGNIAGRHSIDTLKKMSEGQKGRVFSAEHLSMLRKPKLGGALQRTVEKYSTDGTLLKVYASLYEAIEDVNGTKESIIRCCNGKQHTHKGFAWAYGGGGCYH